MTWAQHWVVYIVHLIGSTRRVQYWSYMPGATDLYSYKSMFLSDIHDMKSILAVNRCNVDSGAIVNMLSIL